MDNKKAYALCDRIYKRVDAEVDIRNSTLAHLVEVVVDEGKINEKWREKYAGHVPPQYFDLIEKIATEERDL